MTTYSVRCRNYKCRHRRVVRTHPDEYKRVPACPVCGRRVGWRIEQRAYSKRNLCHCSGPEMTQVDGKMFPHKLAQHRFCDHHPHGFYNQARARGVAHEEIPKEYWP